MQRPILPDDVTWHEGTKSCLEEAQVQACRDLLLSWPGQGIFETRSPLAAAWLEAHSYYHSDGGRTKTAEELRQAILSGVEREALCLGLEEDSLVKRMILTDGTAQITEWGQLPAAESLVRRLWCIPRPEGEEEVLVLADELRQPLLAALGNENCVPAREAMFRLDAMLNCMLYLYGYVFPEPLLEQFLLSAGKWKGLFDYSGLLRYVKASFAYVVTPGGSLLLTHPALRITGRVMDRIFRTDASNWNISGEMMMGGINCLLAEEKPALDCFVSAVKRVIRPENDLRTLADDLRYMAKQGASRQEMVQILSESLCVLPDSGILSALDRVRRETMPWVVFASEELN